MPTAVQSVLCALDGADAQPCTSPVTYQDLSLGEHAFEVTVLDAAGNSSSVSHTWAVVRQDGSSTTTTTTQSGADTTTTEADPSSSTTAAGSPSPTEAAPGQPGPSGGLSRTGGDTGRAAPIGAQLILWGALLCIVAAGVRRRLQHRR